MLDMETDTTEDERMLAGLCYPLWFVMTWFLLFSTRPFLKYHAFQSLLAGLSTAVVYALMWAMFVFSPRPDANTSNLTTYGLTMALWFTLLLVIGVVLFTVYMVWAYKAWMGRLFRIPLLGPLAERMSRV